MGKSHYGRRKQARRWGQQAKIDELTARMFYMVGVALCCRCQVQDQLLRKCMGWHINSHHFLNIVSNVHIHHYFSIILFLFYFRLHTSLCQYYTLPYCYCATGHEHTVSYSVSQKIVCHLLQTVSVVHMLYLLSENHYTVTSACEQLCNNYVICSMAGC